MLVALLYIIDILFQDSLQLKRLEEENADLKCEIESLRRANMRFKSELLNHSKKLEISPRHQDTVRRLVKHPHRPKFSPRNNLTSPRSTSASSLRVIARPGNKVVFQNFLRINSLIRHKPKLPFKAGGWNIFWSYMRL